MMKADNSLYVFLSIIVSVTISIEADRDCVVDYINNMCIYVSARYRHKRLICALMISFCLKI